jgi:hypothetical protein
MKKLALAALLGATVPAYADARSTDLRDRPFNEQTWLTAHNAFANGLPFLPAYLPSQTLTIGEQLVAGARGLMLDIHESNGRVRLCHGLCLGLEPTLADALNNEILPFLRAVPHAIITLHLEDYVERSALAAELAEAPAVAAMTFNPEDWGGYSWPTPHEMAKAGQRIVIFTQEFRNAGPMDTGRGTAHLLYDRDYTSENDWRLGATIFMHELSCVSRWEKQSLSQGLTAGTRAWPRLFVMNHFHDAPFGDHAWQDNSYDALRSRIDDHCMPAAQRRPNYVAVDFVQAGQAASVVGALNAGAIEFFDKAEGKGKRVCAVAAGARRTVTLDEHANERCPPARIRSAVIRDVPAGMRIELADAAGHAAARTVIAVKHDLTGERALVHDIAAEQDDAHLSVRSSSRGFPESVFQVTFTEAP